MPGARYTNLPLDGRPPHAISDRYPYVVNSKNPPYMCVECQDPCGVATFLYERSENIDCETRHSGHATGPGQAAR